MTGLMVPPANAGTLAAGRGGRTAFVSERAQERLRVVSGAGLALAGGFLLFHVDAARDVGAVRVNGRRH